MTKRVIRWEEKSLLGMSLDVQIMRRLAVEVSYEGIANTDTPQAGLSVVLFENVGDIIFLSRHI
jgi:hypothetical protein